MSDSFYHGATDFLSLPANMAQEQVMSPIQEVNDDTNAGQAPSATGHESAASAPATVVSFTAHARSAEPDALARFLEMFTGMDLRMQKIEASQARMDEDERMRGAHESEMFRSELAADFAGRLHGGAMELKDLHDQRPQQQLRRAPARLKDIRVRAGEQLRQRADPLPQPPAPLSPYQPSSVPQAMPAASEHPVQQRQQGMPMQYRTGDARQRKLAIRKFDGTEVSVELGSSFFD